MLPRIGIRAMVAISGAGAGLSYIAMSYFTSLWQFYVAGIVVGFTLPACSFLPASVIITNWFEQRRGMAMGIAMAFTGVYAAIGSTFLPRSEEHTSELQSRPHLVCRLLLEKKK